MLVSIDSLGFGMGNASKLPSAASCSNIKTEVSFPYCSLEGLSIRFFNSSSGQTSSTKMTSPFTRVIAATARSMKSRRTVASGANVKINPGS